MKLFYVTIAANQPFGCGYWEVEAKNRSEAQKKTLDKLGQNWSMLYEDFEQVHPQDRKRYYGRIK
jgi:hypothetical protein